MVTKFTRKELERLKCTEEEIDLVIKYQKKLPIIVENDEVNGFCINARDLWNQIDCPQGQFNKWVERKFMPFGFCEDVDFKPFGQNSPKPQGGRPEKNYMITIDMAKQLAMIDKKETGFLTRRYFILMERIVKDNSDWYCVRNPERKAYNDMCEAISSNVFRSCGRTADKYDFARDANILNVICTGSKAQSIRNYFNLTNNNELTRDSLEIDYNQKISFLQKQNIICLGMNMPILERVKFLISAFDITYPLATPLLPYMSRDDMKRARNELVSELEYKF